MARSPRVRPRLALLGLAACATPSAVAPAPEVPVVKAPPPKQQADSELEAGAAVGVNGTPATFINGRLIMGAHPFEAFQELIDAELKRQ